ncbi:MAG: carboxymuconolactone decarboxylase family protein [Planctomycetota bacterium]
MAYIRVIDPHEASGPLAVEYAAAEKRAGRVWNIVRIMGQNPAVLRASMGLYLSIMHGPSPLSRAQREMIAVVVSQVNGCRY